MDHVWTTERVKDYANAALLGLAKANTEALAEAVRGTDARSLAEVISRMAFIVVGAAQLGKDQPNKGGMTEGLPTGGA